MPQLLHCQLGSRLSFAFTVWQFGAGLARWIEAVGQRHFAVMPLALVDDLPFDLAHAGVGLGFGDLALHHAGYVEVFDDQVPELVDQRCRHLMLCVAAQSYDAAVEIVDTALSFPPTAAAGGAACLGPAAIGGVLAQLGSKLCGLSQTCPSLSVA